jgi:hypothetical protein
MEGDERTMPRRIDPDILEIFKISARSLDDIFNNFKE